MKNNIKASAMDSVVELSPKIKRSRSTFNLPIKHYTSLNVGDLVPLDFTEVLPGDTFNVDLSSFIRMTSPAKRPVMDSLHMDIYAFFVPNRFVDKGWVNIQGENADPWAAAPETCSTLQWANSIEAGSLANHLGLPVQQLSADADWPKLNIYPFYDYYKIINDWFRDENLQAEIGFDTTNGDYVLTDLPTINGKTAFEKGGLFKVAKYHDVFTSALPSPQKGPTVGLLTNEGKAPVGVIPSVSGTTASAVGPSLGSGLTFVAGEFSEYNGGTNGISGNTNKVVADLSGSVLNTINELRLAFQLQKAYELDARSGTRYTESLEARFSVKNPDLRLGRSELLGHYRFDLNMVENGSNSSLGNAEPSAGNLVGNNYQNGISSGTSKTANGQHICVKTFLEHGIFMILGCIRPDLTYQQGVEKFWRKRSRWDFYEPIFSNIGEVPIMKSELFGEVWDNYQGTVNDSVFGYQEAWYEYRYKQNHISGVLASASNEGFDIFHYGQDFASAPVLGSTFIQQDLAAIDRTLAYTSETVDQFICQFVGNIKATRVMPLFSVPGLIDHF